MLALSGTVNGSVVDVPAYSWVTEYKLLLCPSLQRAFMDILCAAPEGSNTMNRRDFSALAGIADGCGVCASSLGKSDCVWVWR